MRLPRLRLLAALKKRPFWPLLLLYYIKTEEFSKVSEHFSKTLLFEWLRMQSFSVASLALAQVTHP